MDRLTGIAAPGSTGVVVKRWVKQESAVTENAAANIGRDLLQSEEHGGISPAVEEVERNIEALAIAHATKLIDDAQDKADALLAAAGAEAEEIRTSAHKEGFEAGLLEAGRLEEERAKEIDGQFLEIMSALSAREDMRDGAMEKHILALSLEVAEKITNIMLEKDDIVFKGWIKEAINRLNAKEKFTIHLNQREYERFFAQGSGWLVDSMQSAPFTVVEDPQIAPGGILLESMDGIVRAGADTRLRKISEALLPNDDEDANL